MKKMIFGLLSLAVLFGSCDRNKDNRREPFQGKDITKNAEIRIEKDSKIAYLDIETKGQWMIFSGNSQDSIDFSTPLLTGTGSGSHKLPVLANKRIYYFLDTPDGKALLAERHLPMVGGYNFRDLGGIRNKDGKYTQWGKIFRSDDLNRLTAEDLAYLESIPLISVVDFRSPEEIKAAPDVVPVTVKKDYTYSIIPGNLSVNMAELDQLKAEQVDSIMKQMNISFVTDSTYYNRYKDFFDLLMNENEVPLLFHCTAGKDRTGMAGALVLYALNIDEQTIMDDYLSSNKYLEEKYKSIKEGHPSLKSLFEVKPEFLQAGIDRMKEDHGSVENFIQNVLDVDIEKFRAKYLY